MKNILLIKILLAICSIYLCFQFIYIHKQIDDSINQKYTTLYKLRGDPSLDTAENRKMYLQKKEDLNNQIESLEKKKFPIWWNSLFSTLLCILLGWWLKIIFTTLFKKTKNIAQT